MIDPTTNLDESYSQQTGAISKTVVLTLTANDGTPLKGPTVNIGTAILAPVGPDGSPNTDGNLYMCSMQIPGLLSVTNDTICVAFSDQAYCQAAAEGFAKSLLAGMSFGAATLSGLDQLNSTPSLPPDLQAAPADGSQVAPGPCAGC